MKKKSRKRYEKYLSKVVINLDRKKFLYIQKQDNILELLKNSPSNLNTIKSLISILKITKPNY
jgi:hypothetical protein